MGFEEFFPLFRDSILGITFLHLNALAHREISPSNILYISQDKYVLADYGQGLNLKQEE
jgi:serine/threonine protein kinase